MPDEVENSEVEKTEEETVEGSESREDEEPKKLGPKGEDALKKERAEKRRLQKELAELRKKNETDSEKLVREAVEKATGETAGRFKKALVRAAAHAAFTEAGFSGKSDVAFRLLDLADIEVDEDGEVVGLEDQVKQAKRDMPELFRRSGAGRGDGADRSSGSSVGPISKTTRELLRQGGF